MGCGGSAEARAEAIRPLAADHVARRPELDRVGLVGVVDPHIAVPGLADAHGVGHSEETLREIFGGDVTLNTQGIEFWLDHGR